jgi:TonB family protein
MTKPELHTESAEARLGKRAHLRRKLAPMAYVELGQDNGGILLNLSEGGFAVQSALSLTSREFPELRFQVPAHQGWLTARGRIVWLSPSKKEAGVQFTELPGEARQQIYKWVSTEGEPEKPTERFPKPPRETRQAKPIIETPYRGVTDAQETTVAYNAAQSQERARSPQTEPAVMAVAEPPAQDFRFTDYSMFAEVPAKEAAWAEPPRRRGSWSARALLVILVATLFFALGATVGRSTVDQWLANLGWSQTSAPDPKGTPPAPPEQSAAASSTDEKETASSATAKSESSGTAKSASAANPPDGKENNQAEANGSKDTEPSTGSTGSSAAGSSSAAAAVAPMPTRRSGTEASAAAPRPRRPAETITPSADVETNRGLEHSILVSPPAPGSRPFYVNLPGEAISASASVAISAQRTLEILPTTSGRSERVIIGKLISHSQPFYPQEARNRRLEGNVELRARVGRTGEIIGVTPVSGPGLLMSAAATAVREWRYEPTYVDGDPQETIADITVVFRLP